MGFNIARAVEVPIEVFGGRVTEMSATDVTEGVSPDEQDNYFVPGSVFSRPCLQRVLLSSYDTNTFTFNKSCVFPNGNIRNLYLSSDGGLLVEDPIGAPGIVTLLTTVPAGSYAKSATAFGREFIAVSDTLHGATIPFQYDGTNLDRVTQDGPGSPPAVSNLILPPSTLSSATGIEGAFIIIPIRGGGTLALGVGTGAANGSSIPLPDGYSTANMLAWSTAGAGTVSSQLSGIFESTMAGGVLNSHWQNRGNADAGSTTSNWAAAAWTDDANVTLTSQVVSGFTFQIITFTTLQGDPLAIVCGFTRDTNSIPVPAGFAGANFYSIQGMATCDNTGNTLDYISCGFAGTTLTAQYKDFDLNVWGGNCNILAIFYQTGGGITTQAVTNGTALLIPTFTGVTACLTQAQVANGGSFSIPAGQVLIDSTVAVNGAAGPAGSNVAHGMGAFGCTGTNFTGYFSDASGHNWGVIGWIWALSSMGSLGADDLVREDNVVTATTIEPHNLQVGYQAQISGVPAASVGGGISSIVLDNENNPGIATVTTETDHGLLPENVVTLAGLTGSSVGGLSTLVRAGGLVTATLSAPASNLQPGVQITITDAADDSFDGTYAVIAVPSPTTFIYAQVDTDGNTTGGTVVLAWPVPSTPDPITYEVLSCPTATSFQIALNYSDGTWTGGTVSFAWDGIFYVTKVIDGLNFQYQQYGPDATSDAAGQVTPYGQAAPGKHLVRCTFLTRNGAVLKSSPWVEFIANGGQYIQIDDLPIGPADVTAARIIEFTGADGSYFFYLAVQPQVNGLIVGTATQVNDNTTTSLVLDFGDNSLFAGTATSIPGNDLNSQIVLDGALGFGYYSTRLVTYGQRNRLQTLLNMGFDGGFLPSTPTVPTGWMPTANTPQTAMSATSAGTSVGGGSPWSNPANVDNAALYASTVLDAGGGGSYSPATQSGGVEANANIDAPNDTETLAFEGLPSVAASAATIFVTVNANFALKPMGTGSVAVQYSKDGGVTWITARSWDATTLGFPDTVVPIPVTGITNIDSLQVQLVAIANYGGIGGPFLSNINMDAFSVQVAGAAATSQTLQAAIEALSIPVTGIITGFSISFTGYYSGAAPSLTASLGIGTEIDSFDLTTAPATYTAGGISDLWGAAWTPATLASLLVNFNAGSTGDSTVYINNLSVTVYYLGGATGMLVNSPLFGQAWKIAPAQANVPQGQLSQSAFQTQNGTPILTASTPYLYRVWLQPSVVDPNLNFVALLSSASAGYASTATVNGAAMSTAGSWFEVPFSLETPATIPEDMMLTIYATTAVVNGTTLVVEEMSVIYAQTPYLDLNLFASYGNNPEGIDGTSGKFGPVTDTRKVMDFGVMRETFYMLTRDPTGRLHETVDNGTTEPSGWDVNEVGANCGALSAFSLTKSQADDTAASGGEEWMAWASSSGARIFGGAYPDKISQEIQPDWENINTAAALTIWCVNDPVERALYFGVPMGTATAPSNILFMSYRQLDSAQAIASSPPFRVSFTGKLIATDNSRKWSLWNVKANCGALMYRTAGTLQLVLGGGNGFYPNTEAGFGQLYTLNQAKYTDDDYGQVFPYYFTCALPTSQQEQALQLGAGQKQINYLLAYVTWVGQITLTAYPNSLSNPWPLSVTRTTSQVNFDLECAMGQVRGSRIFIKFAPIPLADTTDCAYNLQRLAVYVAPAARLKVRGAAQ